MRRVAIRRVIEGLLCEREESFKSFGVCVLEVHPFEKVRDMRNDVVNVEVHLRLAFFLLALSFAKTGR